jgi:hypothetical protein
VADAGLVERLLPSQACRLPISPTSCAPKKGDLGSFDEWLKTVDPKLYRNWRGAFWSIAFWS